MVLPPLTSKCTVPRTATATTPSPYRLRLSWATQDTPVRPPTETTRLHRPQVSTRTQGLPTRISLPLPARRATLRSGTLGRQARALWPLRRRRQWQATTTMTGLSLRTTKIWPRSSSMCPHGSRRLEGTTMTRSRLLQAPTRPSRKRKRKSERRERRLGRRKSARRSKRPRTRSSRASSKRKRTQGAQATSAVVTPGLELWGREQAQPRRLLRKSR
mmetsp:Transcript_6090/g.19700  ORF Transcript_6090/g.19700 Transcript_6090/m.19700 type:complete len:216 (+) Transcript_6090:1050-1697(+)